MVAPCEGRKAFMNILTFNCGSSSLTFKVFSVDPDDTIGVVLSGKAHRVGVKGSRSSSIEYEQGGVRNSVEIPLDNHGQAAELVLKKVGELGITLDCIGHRWVHAAGHFHTAWIDDALLLQLKALVPILPVHHPAILRVIYACRKVLPSLPEYVTADGAFHSTIPACAYTYLLPEDLVKRFGFRKHGFHGLSYRYVVHKTAEYLGIPLQGSRMVACHLGTGGSSAVAVKDGKSVDTSMGYTALSGLVMSTRSGDIDPILTLYLMAVYGYHPDELMDMLNKKSGLLGISGFSSDIRDIIQRIDKDPQAQLAFDMYVYRLKKYIGSYVAVLGGLDVLVFTDDIGVHNWLVRERVCRGMDWCGVRLDGEANQRASGDAIARLDAPDSKVKVLIVPTEEELVIAWEGLGLMKGMRDVASVCS
jgi:acetate kinase